MSIFVYGGNEEIFFRLQVTSESRVSSKASAHPLKVMIAGAPAAGKGTQCEKIVKKVRNVPLLVLFGHTCGAIASY